MTDNQLASETSPYLRQHAGNPVAWRPWGSEALAEAKRADKPILLSVGYAACHWCHVMAHESFENEAIAAVMNEHFVNIKVDREERPDIDHIYQMALALMGQPGGWPLTMFLTPEGEPFWGGTYFPALPRYGRPGFADILARITQIYHENKEAVDHNRKAILDHLHRATAQPEPGVLAPDLLDQVATKLAQHVDPARGGMGGAPKFPQPFAFEFLWRAHVRSGEPRYRDLVCLTLDHIAQGGIYDHLGGGFARYSVDAEWLVPHFEKMLYDNALLISLYTLVWRETRSDLYRQRIAETIEWLAREMTLESGAFASSLDADSAGGEGTYYVWRWEDVERILPPEDFRLFADTYGLSPGGNWEGVNILNRLSALAPFDDAAESRLAACRQLLFRERDRRPRPARDDKVLADWNGMAIAALARAAATFRREDWRERAVAAFRFVSENMAGPDDRLFHAACDGRVQPISLLDDHAHMSAAALALYEATGAAGYLEIAERWAEAVERLFGGEDDGGYYSTAADAEGLILRSRNAHDSAQPSANGTMLDNFARLFALTGDARWQRRADALAEAFGGEAVRNFFPLAGFLNGYDTLVNGVAATVLVARDDPAAAPFLDAYFGTSLPGGTLKTVDRLEALGAADPARSADAPPGSALVCARQTCSLPLKTADAFAAELRARCSAATGQA